MEKIKNVSAIFRNLSLRKSIACYIVFFVLAALMLGSVTEGICSAVSEKIHGKYYDYAERYYLTNAEGEQLGESTYVWKEEYPKSEKDKKLLTLLDMIPMIAYPLYSGLCVMAAAALFYRNKLKRPLALLTEASGKISRNDLDFSIGYENRDEMGQLCASFEIMRSRLEENYISMWRTMEERKRLNAAFAHDLRTPLTVLKGYNELLLLSEETKERATAATMEKHISRMEQYVDSMSRIRRLEDREAVCAAVELEPWLAALRQSMEIFCREKGKKLEFRQEISSGRMNLDAGLIQQVADNLLSNAVRFGRERIQVQVYEQNDGLTLMVADDGRGFSPKALEKALEPYYHEERKKDEDGESAGSVGDKMNSGGRGIAESDGKAIGRGIAESGGKAIGRGIAESDGKAAGRENVGSDGKALDRAREEKEGEHFGLGLYICKILCRHHGGCLQIGNTGNGGLVTAFFRSVEDVGR